MINVVLDKNVVIVLKMESINVNLVSDKCSVQVKTVGKEPSHAML